MSEPHFEAPAPIIDDHACRVYYREISGMLGCHSTGLILNTAGKILWCSDDSVSPELLRQLSGLETVVNSTPQKRQLSASIFCYEFPLTTSLERRLRLVLLVQDNDPPRLSDVVSLTGQTIDCLARQIDIDTNLTSSCIVPPEAVRRLPEWIDESNSENSVSEIATLWCKQARNELQCVAVAAAIPEEGLLASDCESADLAKKVPALLKKARTTTSARRRIVSIKLARRHDTDLTLIAAPIVGRKNRITGSVLLISKDRNSIQLRLLRTLSNRISALCQNRDLKKKSLSRTDIIASIQDAFASQPGLTHGLIYLDIDKVHAINDAFGYSAGDQAIARLQQTLEDCAGSQDCAARITSDRFALFMPGASPETATAKAQQIVRLYNQEYIDDDEKSIQLATSAGIATSDPGSTDPEHLIVFAEVAARAAKERGGNQTAVYQDIDDSMIQRRGDVDRVGYLQMALIENKFVLYAQRIVPTRANGGLKYELLTRLDQESNQIAHPSQLLSAAERYHLMAALDRWVINTALSAIVNAANSLEVNLTTFCINVSVQSMQDDSFIDFIETRMAECGIAPDTLCFEITETSLVKDITKAQKFVSRLQRQGCKVALDDFGTGYSSFSYLKTLPVDFFKIDGLFVRDLIESPLSRAIISSVVKIASVTGAQTVAEHVENDMVKARLKDLGVHYLQGFAIHKPEPFTNVLKTLSENTGDSSTNHSNNDELLSLDDYTSPPEKRAKY